MRHYYGVERLCRGDIPLKVSDQFITKLNELEDANRASPVVLDDSTSFIYIQYSNLYVLALSKTNSNAAAILAFLHKIVEIFKHYFREVKDRHFSCCNKFVFFQQHIQ